MPRCIKCSKPLTAPESVDRSMGPICAGQASADAHRLEQERGDKYDLHFNNATQDIVCSRDAAGVLHFNIYPIIAHHSPTGWNWGYAGSGCADFALNIIEFFVRQTELPKVKINDYTDRQRVVRKKICRTTQRIYQDFKAKFIATLPEQGGVILGADIRAFIESSKVRPAHTF